MRVTAKTAPLASYIYIVYIHDQCVIHGITTKHRRNRRHGIAFEDAVRIFEGPTVEKVDDVTTTRKSACMLLASSTA